MRTLTGIEIKRVATGLAVAALFAIALPALLAQNQNMGEITGTVTDISGGRVPDVAVSFTNIDTGIVTRVATNQTGTYDAPLLPPGAYTVEFSRQGYKKFVRKGIELHIKVVTLNAVLSPGATSETVTVTSNLPLIQTSTPTRSYVFTDQTLNNLPNVGRAWWDITGQLPGSNPGGQGADGAGQDASGSFFGMNGNPGWQENFMTDGGVNTSPSSQNPLNMVPLDDIAEVDINTSNFGAQYGSGVATLNVITKSGTNRFHGSIYDFEQNNALGEARNYFAPTVEPLRWHMYGVTLGGPIIKNRAFFFFSFQGNPSVSYSPSFYTFPTPAMMSGNFSAFLTSPEGVINPCNGQQMIQGQIYDPATYNAVLDCRLPFPNNQIPSRFDPVAKAVQGFFPKVANGPGIPSNNFFFNGASISHSPNYNYKVDFVISPSNRLSTSGQFNPNSSPPEGPTCPIGCSSFTGLNSNVQISDVWTASPRFINEARVSFVRQSNRAIPQDEGKGYPAKLGLVNTVSDVFPVLSMDGEGGTGLSTGTSWVLGYSVFMYSDSATWNKGRHIFKFGGEFDRDQDNQAFSNLQSADYDFAGGYTSNPVDPNPATIGYADFLLGLPDSWSVTVTPETGMRMWSFQAFLNDEFKATPHLNLTLGMRYQIQSGWREIENRFASFNPNLFNSGENPTTNNGGLPYPAGPGANCFAGVTFGNFHCPTQQEATIYDIFQPRFGFAWAPRGDRWSVRGGFGIYTEQWGANNYYNTFAPGYGTFGSVSTPDPVRVLLPFTLAQGPPASDIIPSGPSARQPWSLNGNGTSGVPYHVKAAYVEQYSLTVERQIGPVALDAAYVGSRGLHLLFGRNIDQTPEAFLGQGFAGLPYPQYPGGGISMNLYDGISNYNALQLSARTRATTALSFMASYTFSKTMDEYDSPGTCCTPDVGGYQNAYDPAAMYAVAGYDIPQLWNGSATYHLPFGRGRALLNRGGLVNNLVGGWRLSGVFQVHGGLPFTPTMADNSFEGIINGAAWWPNRVCNGKLSHPQVVSSLPNGALDTGWFQSTCFVQPAPNTFGNSSRNILRGPSWRNVNLSLAKGFAIPKLGEAGRLELRVDSYDIANHPNFGQPSASIGSGGEGTITSANTNRNFQVGAKLSF